MMIYSKFKIFLCAIIAFSSSFVVAQSNILNASTPSEVGVQADEASEAIQDEPLEYGYIDDRDILWSKIVWEKIDLNQKVNFPLLYPTNDKGTSDRRSLFKVLLQAIAEGAKDSNSSTGITEVYNTSYFKNKMTFDDIKQRIKDINLPDVALEILGQYGITGTENIDVFVKRALKGTLSNYPKEYPEKLVAEMAPYIAPTEITSRDILEYRIKGMWYFDKLQGEMRYRLLGIAPAGKDIKSRSNQDSGAGDSQNQNVPYFWVWFPDARQALHNAKVLNNENSSMPFSYDHILNSRRFDAVIYKTQNMYEDREVSEYIQDNALLQLLESNRIKEEIRNFELDMWSY